MSERHLTVVQVLPALDGGGLARQVLEVAKNRCAAAMPPGWCRAVASWYRASPAK